jgi:hypothetical protein
MYSDLFWHKRYLSDMNGNAFTLWIDLIKIILEQQEKTNVIFFKSRQY